VAPQKLYELRLSRFDVAWPPTQGGAGRVWSRDTLIIDANWDLWICVTTGNPGTWKKLSGTGGAASYVAENLTAQVDGLTNTFTTGSARHAGTIRVYNNGQDLGTPGVIATGAEVEEIDPTTFQLSRVPIVGEKLHVSYFL